jgi:hypothetical protein
MCPGINQSERKVYIRYRTFWREGLEGLKRCNASSLWCHVYAWHKFTYRLAITLHFLIPKKSDVAPKMRNWTGDTVLQSLGHFSSWKISNNWGFLMDKRLIFVVRLFLLKKSNFGSFGNILPYRTHKLHCFELKTLFFRTKDTHECTCVHTTMYECTRVYK